MDVKERIRVKWWSSKERREIGREWQSRHYCVGETVVVRGEWMKIVSMSVRWDDVEDVQMQCLGVIPTQALHDGPV